MITDTHFYQDTFDHDKGQKSVISGRRLHWRLSAGFFCFLSSIYLQFSKTSPLKSGESSEKSSGENRIKSCHVCGCHGFFGPDFSIWELIAQLHRTCVTQGFLAGIVLCNWYAFIQCFLWTHQLHINCLGISLPTARTAVTQNSCFRIISVIISGLIVWISLEIHMDQWLSNLSKSLESSDLDRCWSKECSFFKICCLFCGVVSSGAWAAWLPSRYTWWLVW